MKKTTIKDVAKKSGYSISTVSNALNDVDVLKQETKEHILEVARELNYVPNIYGQLLKSKKSNRITFITSTVVGPYFYHLVESMALECDRHGYSLNIIVTQDPNEIKKTISGGGSDGLIVFQESEVSTQEIETIITQQTKTVFIDREIKDKNIGSVTFDSFYSAYETTRTLIELGHKKIMFIEGIEAMYDSIERKKGYLKAMKEANLEISDKYILPGGFEEYMSYLSVTDFLKTEKEYPTAIVASNDLSALGAIKAIQERGLEVPGDISVVGFDDIDISQYFNPSLTTTKNPISELGRKSVELLNKMMNEEMDGDSIILKGELKLRESMSENTTDL